MIETLVIASRIAAIFSVTLTVEAVVIVCAVVLGVNHVKKLLSK